MPKYRICFWVIFFRVFALVEIAKFTPQEQREYEASKMAIATSRIRLIPPREKEKKKD